MEVIDLAWWKLGLAALLVLALAGTGYLARLGITRNLLIAALRTVIQLALIGLVLEALFASSGFYWIALMALVMLLVAGREVVARQGRRLQGWWAFGIGTGSMFVSSFSVTVLALSVVIGPDPWYTPQYAIPLLGMMLGNTMTGVSLALDRLNESVWRQRAVIENRLMLGQTWKQALEDIRRDAMRSGMMPSINAMAAAGIVSLPGMMTGQILAGSPPAVAVKYQILVMLIITVGTGFGALMAVSWGGRRLFDDRERLRLDRLVKQ
ncbi:putative ABC transport system permease protein [Marinobacter sp. DSM 26671]|jgi:putative ABC transport system permease protein|uniref:Iron export ABC transporter permease subunit FetB n=3 Tax=Marinobacter TaxID=2742 RepID=A0A3D8H306_9GAMM|nr:MULTISPECIES: iron export ABC transporter permease subunit FetB [Marinobacter]MEC7728976.1 iron export ABC transporter permease subunit FetB [Pseudomonadota bacterium]AKV96013.1 ABC transporter permease [Marinobacter sp. CP1]MAK48666.1 iron export ABC transporter permease subunit FetB [Marinobacter sp.]MBQ92635.1 iron export ABC transporter permease subunit FetB [Marinobacter sp.]MBW3227004.1 iron export ABC transporter permease subunit FetB [Marinobacter adhaerens]|tara:strand:- start:5476 stop:6273 length:798 start_codon:yes stop_codon:yes gene_type:complete